MSIIERLSSSMGRKDNIPNQELAKEIAEKNNNEAIEELVNNLENSNKTIQGDCLKVLYEIGYIKPDLISAYVDVFCDLLKIKNNRLIWGAMIALSTIAGLEPGRVYKRLKEIMKAIEKGSVITIDNGISVLAHVASAKKEYEKEIFPYLIQHLEHCRTKEVAQHAERIMFAVNDNNMKDYKRVLKLRLDKVSDPQKKRINKILKKIDA